LAAESPTKADENAETNIERNAINQLKKKRATSFHLLK
jgi:hypothetical protein